MFKWHPQVTRIERAIFSGQFKFIGSTADKRELYRFVERPGSERDSYQIDNGASRELEARLNQWLKKINEESGRPSQLDKGSSSTV